MTYQTAVRHFVCYWVLSIVFLVLAFWAMPTGSHMQRVGAAVFIAIARDLWRCAFYPRDTGA